MYDINWSAIPATSLVGRILRWPLKFLPKNLMISIRRGPARGMKWICGSSNHGVWLGTYELDKQLALERFVRPGMTVYDIGAHAGFYTLFFSRLVGATGCVYAFEPFPNNVRFLLTHIRVNCLRGVRVIQAAVADTSGLRGFTSDRGSATNALVRGDEVLRVPTVTIDDAVRVHGLPPPNLVKLDVEGAELAVLQGAQRTILEHRPILFVALDAPEQATLCGDFLETLGYKAYDLKDRALDRALVSDEIYALPPKS